MQRSHTLPSDLSAKSDRPTTPPLNTIEMLDLVDSPVLPSPSQLPVKKAKTRTTKMPAFTRATRGTSVTSSPDKSRQTTLDAWRSSEAPSPTRCRRTTPSANTVSLAQSPGLRPPREEVDTLDLTFSSPLAVPPPTQKTRTTGPTRSAATCKARPPLLSISSNGSHHSSRSSRSNSSGPTTIPTLNTKPKTRTDLTNIPQTRRTSPRFQKSELAPLEIDSLDLTIISPPPRSPKNLPSYPEFDALDLTQLESAPRPIATRSPSIEIETLEQTEVVPSPPPTAPVASWCFTNTQAAASISTVITSVSSPSRQIDGSGQGQISTPAPLKNQVKRKREIVLRKSLVGAWDFAEIDSPTSLERRIAQDSGKGNDSGSKGQSRRRWRESEVEILDLT